MSLPRSRCRVLLRFVISIGGLLAMFAFVPPVGAHADLVRTEPAANATVAPGLTQIRLGFTVAPDPLHTTITIYSAQHQQIGTGTPHIAPDDASALLVPLPRVPVGIYTVVWTTTALQDGDTARGSFAFSVNPTAAGQAVVQQPQPRFALSTLDRAIPRWLAFVGIMTVVGSLSLRFLVWRPALAHIGGSDPDGSSSADAETDARRVDWRLLRVAGGATVLFVLATLTQFIWEAGNAAKRPFPTIDRTMLVAFLGTAGSGNLWAVRLMLTAGLAVAILPVAARTSRASRKLSPRVVTLAMLLGLLCGVSELLVRTLPGRVTLSLPRTVFTSLADWAHLLGAAVWLGGLAGLVITASLLRPPTEGPNTRLRAVARRFSYVALTCVGILTLSGLWTAWIHVGSVPLLFTTLYGQTLLVKLALFLALVALGAFNLLWLLPRMDTARVAANHTGQSGLNAFLRPFRRAIAVEAFIGLVILLIVPFLSGSARTQAAQLQAANLTQTAMAGDIPVTFTPSALQPGMVRYDVSAPARDITGISLAFASPALGVPETTASATAEGEGRYQVTGLYTAMIGPWSARVTLHGPGAAERSAQFDLPIRATPVTAGAVTAQVRGTTWAYGALETLLVLLALGSAVFLSRRLASHRTAATDTAPADEKSGGTRTAGTVALALAGAVVLAVILWQAVAWHGAPPDPTNPDATLSPGIVIVNSGILVFREGLEMILVLSAVTASFLGANASYRRPVAAGAGVGFAASVATWFIVVAILDAINAPALAVQAATGLLAIIVLLVIMNWFFHRVYWAGWIGHHQKRRKQLLAHGADGSRSRLLLGLGLLGFTSVYREGFEVVLFLQNLRLRAGIGPVVAGVGIGLALTTIVGVLTFALHHKLPYKKMLVLTGVMLGAVLLVMVGESVQEMQLAGWLPTTALTLPIPGWMGLWFAVFPNLEGLLAQALAAALVIGSYMAAGYVQVRLPRRRGDQPAFRPDAPPALTRDEHQPA